MVQKKEKILIIINGILFSLIVLYAVFFRNTASLPSEKTSLVNKKYIALIDSIRIVDPINSKSIFLHKSNADWYGVYEAKNSKQIGEPVLFPLKLPVNTFLTSMSTVRKVQKVSNSFESWSSFGLTADDALSITFENSQTMEIYSQLYMGSENFNGQNIYFRTDKAAVYQTAYDFFSYAQADLNLWCDNALIPSYTNITEQSVQSIILLRNEDELLQKKIERSSDLFHDYVNRLILSTGKPVEKKQMINPVLNIAIENGDGSMFALEIFYDTASDLYYIEHKNTIYSYALEISSWTFNRLLEPFN